MTSARAIRVLDTREWRLPGCDGRCWPRAHSPEAHEEYGYQRGLAAAKRTVVQTGPLTVDLDACRVTVYGEPVYPTAREWALLSLLAQSPGNAVTADTLVRAIWGEDKVTARVLLRNRAHSGGSLGKHSLRVTMRRLRVKLGAAGSTIDSIHGIGYRLRMEAGT